LTPARGVSPVPLGRIAELAGATLEGDPAVAIAGMSGLEDAEEGDVSFLASARYAPHLASTRATAVFLAPGTQAPPHVHVLRAADPYVAFARVLPLFAPASTEVPPGAHPSAVVGAGVSMGARAGVGPLAVIEDGAVIGAGSRIGPGCVIGRNAVIGENCTLHARVVVAHGCILGNRVIVQPGAVIGADGFGYTFQDGAFHKVPQIGIVEIGDDVEIGANACIDRATIGKTRVGRGTKIDNLVQLAHNVAVGEGCAFAAQSGVAGSTRIGKGVQLGGQAGVGGHMRVGDGVVVAGRGGVIGAIDAGSTVSGYPARDHRTMMRVHAALLQLPDLIRRLRKLEKHSESESGPEE
jgi:UDP-3-O-[3-hydroxymyristoyl] glucosamine N-acyltransferase